MADIDSDSFDGRSTAQFLRHTLWTATNGATLVAAAAQHGSQGLRVAVNNAVFGPTMSVPVSASYTLGFNLRLASLPAVAVNPYMALLQFSNGATPHIFMRITAAGNLDIYRSTGGTGGTLIATFSYGIQGGINTWFEVAVTIADAGGLVEVRKNGTFIGAFSGDTRNGSLAQIDTIQLFPTLQNLGGVAINADVDDLVIRDAVSYPGVCRVDGVLATGAGNYSELATLFGDTTYWQTTEDNPADDDTTYAEDSVVDTRSTAVFADLPAAVQTILFVNFYMHAKATGAGGAMARMLRRAGTDSQGPDQNLNNGNYEQLRNILSTDPIAAGAWTPANFNASEWGVRVR